jgi:hypothetical protein
VDRRFIISYSFMERKQSAARRARILRSDTQALVQPSSDEEQEDSETPSQSLSRNPEAKEESDQLVADIDQQEEKNGNTTN